MYGKALCLYLENELPKIGIEVPFYCNEDWGWWLEVLDGDFKMALCIYCETDDDDDPFKYTLMPSIVKSRVWSWSKFRKIDVSSQVLKIMHKLQCLFEKDTEVISVEKHNDYRFE